MEMQRATWKFKRKLFNKMKLSGRLNVEVDSRGSKSRVDCELTSPATFLSISAFGNVWSLKALSDQLEASSKCFKSFLNYLKNVWTFNSRKFSKLSRLHHQFRASTIKLSNIFKNVSCTPVETNLEHFIVQGSHFLVSSGSIRIDAEGSWTLLTLASCFGDRRGLFRRCVLAGIDSDRCRTCSQVRCRSARPWGRHQEASRRSGRWFDPSAWLSTWTPSWHSLMLRGVASIRQPARICERKTNC